MKKSAITTRRWQLAAQPCAPIPARPLRVRRYRLVPKPSINAR
jgi:hypothetical protein